MDCASRKNTDGGAGAPEDRKDEPQTSESNKPFRWAIADLLKGGRVAIIEHAGEEYRLRLTANDKLILTK
ncbi:hemin uptake protein HemP [Methyloligella sp. 2.7D]|uniref:hemin uptake protein HemP n=1 Tax=Methyloligella sp. 2.7D TaxID=3085160 RepID=UPI00157DA9A7|nr:hemin uptake protein HemP [Methyloligella sp. GL2]QKP77290.1 hemin uptake protein HemP [Methyloligella sp. GL2]